MDRNLEEAKAFHAMHAELVKQHQGQVVAVHEGQVLDHDEDFVTLQPAHLGVFRSHGIQAAEGFIATIQELIDLGRELAAKEGL